MRAQSILKRTSQQVTNQDDDIQIDPQSKELTMSDKKMLENIQRNKKKKIKKGEIIEGFAYIAIKDLKDEIRDETLRKYGSYSRDGLVPVRIPSSNVHLNYKKLLSDHFARISNLTVANKIISVLEKCSMLSNDLEKIFSLITQITNYNNDFEQQIGIVQKSTNECAQLCLALKTGTPVTPKQIEDKLNEMDVDSKKLMQIKKEGFQKELTIFPSYDSMLPQLNGIKDALEQILRPAGNSDLKAWHEAWSYYNSLENSIKTMLPHFQHTISEKNEKTVILFEICKKETIEMSELAEDILDNFSNNSENKDAKQTTGVVHQHTFPQTIPQQNSQRSYANAQHSTQFKSVPSTNSQHAIHSASQGQRISPPPSPIRI